MDVSITLWTVNPVMSEQRGVVIPKVRRNGAAAAACRQNGGEGKAKVVILHLIFIHIPMIIKRLSTNDAAMDMKFD
jgi:hypothetical protein